MCHDIASEKPTDLRDFYHLKSIKGFEIRRRLRLLFQEQKPPYENGDKLRKLIIGRPARVMPICVFIDN